MLLTSSASKGALSGQAAAALSDGGFSTVRLVGGEYWMGPGVLEGARRALPEGADVDRVAGADAAATALEFAGWSLSRGMSPDGAGLATSGTPQDALAGAAFCGRSGAPLLLASRGSGAPEAKSFAAEHCGSICRGWFIGGPYWLDEDLRAEFEKVVS